VSVPGWQQPERIRAWGMVSWAALGVILLALASFWLLGTLDGLIIPVIVATVLAVVFNPVVARLQRWHIPRMVGALLVFLVATGMVVALVWAVLGIAIERAPEFIDAFYKGIADLARMLDAPAAGVWATASAQHAEARAQDFLLTGVLPLVGQGVMAGVGMVMAVIIVLFFLFFLLWDGPLLRRGVEKLSGLSPDGAHRLTGAMISVTRRYMVGMTIVAGINFVIGAGFSIAAGLDVWLGIALILFLGTYVPYLGGIAAGVVSVLVALGMGGPDAALIVLVGVLLINVFVQSNVQTFAVGAVLRLRPSAVFALAMLGILLGGAIGGAAAAPLARLVLDARAVVREDRAETEADESGAGPTTGLERDSNGRYS
jgi:putative heme transporter